MKRVVFVLPVFPSYREEFFDLLVSDAEKKGGEIIVVAGSQVVKKSIKVDQRDRNYNLVFQKSMGVSFFGVNFQWQIGLLRELFRLKPDKVVVSLRSGILNQYILLLVLMVCSTPYYIWGVRFKRVDLNQSILKIKHRMRWFFERRCAGYFVYGSKVAKELTLEGLSKGKVHVAQNTIHVERLVRESKRDSRLCRDGVVKILFVGALIKSKNLEHALSALAKVKSDALQFEFHVVGGGRLNEGLRRQVSDLGLVDSVFFHGPLYSEELTNIFSECDLFLLPGTGGLAVNEAMANGLVVLTSPGDGTAFDLVDQRYGLVFDYDVKEDELSSILREYIALGRCELRRMGRENQKIILEKAPLRRMVEVFSYELCK